MEVQFQEVKSHHPEVAGHQEDKSFIMWFTISLLVLGGMSFGMMSLRTQQPVVVEEPKYTPPPQRSFSDGEGWTVQLVCKGGVCGEKPATKVVD